MSLDLPRSLAPLPKRARDSFYILRDHYVSSDNYEMCSSERRINTPDLAKLRDVHFLAERSEIYFFVLTK
jgi:hypothetical protein